MTVNGKTVPFPMDEPPSQGQRVYFPDLLLSELVDRAMWRGGKDQITLLRRGLIHDTEEGAKTHAEALLEPSWAECGRVDQLLERGHR